MAVAAPESTATGNASRMSTPAKAADLPTAALHAELHRRYDHLSRAVALTLADLIRDAGLTQRDISAETDIPTSTLSRLLRGGGKLYLRDVFGIADAVGVSPAEVIRRAQVRRLGGDGPQCPADGSGG